MFDITTLKPTVTVTDSQVECPVVGCTEKVAKQTSRYISHEPRFQCPKHRIFISPSTFEYPSELDNLLWKDSEDTELLRRIKAVKRESRIARDNSEDALTWNVFRYLDKKAYVSALLSQFLGATLSDVHLVYWSYSPKDQGTWPELAKARLEFGEPRGSEPDLIAIDQKAVIFVEAKLTAPNKTKTDPGAQKKYTTGGNAWYSRVFNSDFNTIANLAKKYELMRYWLLGSWIAANTGRRFYLVNLVRSEYDRDIVNRFLQHVTPSDSRYFVRITWEGIYAYVAEQITPTGDRDLLLSYLRHKTVGYRAGELQQAFCIT